MSLFFKVTIILKIHALLGHHDFGCEVSSTNSGKRLFCIHFQKRSTAGYLLGTMETLGSPMDREPHAPTIHDCSISPPVLGISFSPVHLI